MIDGEICLSHYRPFYYKGKILGVCIIYIYAKGLFRQYDKSNKNITTNRIT